MLPGPPAELVAHNNERNGMSLPIEVIQRDKELRAVVESYEMSDSERLEMWARLANDSHHRSLHGDTPALDGFWAGVALNEAQRFMRATSKRWSVWLKAHFDGSQAAAKRYQALADGYGLPEFVEPGLSVGEALMKL